jgi:hypothetical protein
MIDESVEYELAGEIGVLGEKVPQYYFVHYESHMSSPGIEFRLPRWEARD